MSDGSKLPRRVRSRGPLLNDLPRRAFLTIKHHGWRELLARLVTAPLRLFGEDRRARARLELWADQRQAGRWYREAGRPVTIVMPTYGDPSTTIDAVKRLRRTIDQSRTRILVVDDGSSRQDQEKLLEIEGADVELATANRGYAASVNRGLARADHGHDVVVLNNDVIGHRGWLQTLQQAAYGDDDTGVVGPMLLYPDGRIQAAGAHRNLGALEWFDHRYRFKRPDYGPAAVPDDALAVTGAAMYLRRSLIDRLGEFDESFPWHTRTSTTACGRGKPDSKCAMSRLLDSRTWNRRRAEPLLEHVSCALKSIFGRSGALGSTREAFGPPTVHCASYT